MRNVLTRRSVLVIATFAIISLIAITLPNWNTARAIDFGTGGNIIIESGLDVACRPFLPVHLETVHSVDDLAIYWSFDPPQETNAPPLRPGATHFVCGPAFVNNGIRWVRFLLATNADHPVCGNKAHPPICLAKASAFGM